MNTNEPKQQTPLTDANVESVRTKLLTRSRVGIAKYGVTTERADLSLRDWLKHLQEELMDAAVYAEAADLKARSLELKLQETKLWIEKSNTAQYALELEEKLKEAERQRDEAKEENVKLTAKLVELQSSHE